MGGAKIRAHAQAEVSPHCREHWPGMIVDFLTELQSDLVL